jgi:hypothetical protein
MAKELPYFKFEPAEYLTKDISFCSISAQGLFINICSYYWQRQCSLTLEQISRRFNYPNELDELINEGIIDVSENTISIKFLDNQLDEVCKLSNKNSANGSKGGRPKKNPNETQTEPNLNPNESQTKGIREEEIKEDNIIVNNTIPTLEEFMAYGLSKLEDVSHDALKLKYEVWLANDWCITRDDISKPILRWKTTLLNTLVYLPKQPKQQKKEFVFRNGEGMTQEELNQYSKDLVAFRLTQIAENE